MPRFLGAALLTLALWGGTARAEVPNVLVRDFRGPKAKPMRAGVIAALKKQVRVVKNAHAADNILEGIVSHKGSDWKLIITVRVAATGSWIDDVVLRLSRSSLSSKARKSVSKKVMALIRRSGGGDDEEVALAAKEKRGKKKKTPDDDENDATGAAGAFANDEDGAGSSSEAEPAAATTGGPPKKLEVETLKPKEKQVATAQAPAPAPAETAVAKPTSDAEIARAPAETPAAHRAFGGDIFSLSAGASFQQRNFQAVGFGRLPIYTSDMYPSIYAGGTLYPLGFTHAFVRGFGVFGTFERALGLKSRVQATGEVFDTVAQRIEAGALWRIHIGGPTGPTFRPMGLIGQQKFEIGGMTDMPDTDYDYYGGGMDLDLPIFTPALALTGAFQYDQIQSLGATASFGQTATAWGYAWEAGLRADLPWRLRGQAVFTDVKRNASYSGLSMTGVTASQAHDEWIGGRVALALDF